MKVDISLYKYANEYWVSPGFGDLPPYQKVADGEPAKVDYWEVLLILKSL